MTSPKSEKLYRTYLGPFRIGKVNLTYHKGEIVRGTKIRVTQEEADAIDKLPEQWYIPRKRRTPDGSDEKYESGLTIFSCPKAFNHAYGAIQSNAIKSWKLLKPTPRIILFTDRENRESVKEAAIKLDVDFGGAVRCNCQGTPLIRSLWNYAEKGASTQLLAYVNTDILLMQDWGDAVSFIESDRTEFAEFDRFLAIGRRWDWHKIRRGRGVSPDAICFDDTWEACIRADCKLVGNWHPPGGFDYFVFSRGLYKDMPLFAIGRYAWDNWFVAEALRLRVPVIDITKVAFAVHQRHQYGQSGELTGADLLKTSEAKANKKLFLDIGALNASLKHTTYYLIKTGGQYRAIRK